MSSNQRLTMRTLSGGSPTPVSYPVRLQRLRTAVVVAAIGDDRRGAAALASPGLEALLHGDAGYEQRRDRVRSPEPEERVGGGILGSLDAQQPLADVLGSRGVHTALLAHDYILTYVDTL